MVWALILLGTVGAGTVASESAAPSGETQAPAVEEVAPMRFSDMRLLFTQPLLRDPTAPSSDFGAGSPQ